MTLTKETLEELKKEIRVARKHYACYPADEDELLALISAAEELERVKAILNIHLEAPELSGNEMAAQVCSDYGSLRAKLRSVTEATGRIVKERDAWKADAVRLAEYASHQKSCRIHCRCTCGYTQALESHNNLMK